jgi:hypothetical protein
MIIDIAAGLKITRYGYRKKKVINRILRIDYGTGDQMSELQDYLREVTGCRDNHETFILEHENGGKIVLQFSDWVCYIGTDIADF